MDLLGTKILVLILLALIKLLFGLAPIILTKYMRLHQGSKTVDRFIGIVLCIGGGVLLATVFVHMIPEVRESLNHATELGFLPEDPHYPFAELFICLGFFMIYAVEAFVHKIFAHHHGHHGHHGMPAVDNEHELANQKDGLDNGGFVEEGKHEIDKVQDIEDDAKVKEKNNFHSFSKISRHSDNVYNVSSATLTSYTSHNSDGLDTSLPSFVSRPNEAKPTTPRMINKVKEKKLLGQVRNFLLIMALSLHSMFEGMAVGLQLDKVDVWKLFAAIGIHSMAIVFCIGVDMLTSKTKKSHIVFYISVFALISSVGVIIGILVTEHVDEKSGVQTLIIGILQGLAGGTLLYITFYEVMDRDKLVKTKMTGLVGFTFLFIGFAFMASLEALGGHSHGEVGHEGHGHGAAASGHHGHAHGGHGDQDDHLDHAEDHLKAGIEQHEDHDHDHSRALHGELDNHNDHEHEEKDHEDHDHHEDPHHDNETHGHTEAHHDEHDDHDHKHGEQGHAEAHHDEHDHKHDGGGHTEAHHDHKHGEQSHVEAHHDDHDDHDHKHDIQGHDAEAHHDDHDHDH